MKLFNNLENKLVDFQPIEENKVRIYVCGPTVYNDIHIGNARPLVVFDVLHRYFKLLKYEVTFISNITDIDDKIINKAIEENVSEQEIASRYLNRYLDVSSNFNCLDVTHRPLVTQYLEQIKNFIDELVINDYAYELDGNVYFRVNKVNEYGMLSNQKLDQLQNTREIVSNQKEYEFDFTLWKNTEVGIKYDFKYGKGRPGWHTECVVMIKSLVDKVVDIHAGGSDLMFPHHENEIAQSIAFDQTTLANYWLHNGLLNLDGIKMSKSLNNVISAQDFVSKYGSNVARLSLLQTQYRMNINFTDDLIEQTIKLNSKIEAMYKQLSLESQLNPVDIVKPSQFLKIYENDLDTSNVITYLLGLIKEINVASRNNEAIGQYLNEFDEILYLLGLSYVYPILSDEDIKMYQEWQELKMNKDFAKADELRKVLQEKGVL